MHKTIAQKIALNLCMQNVGRYLECLNFTVCTFERALPKSFVSEVKRDFEEYSIKMEAAGMKVSVVTGVPLEQA